MITFTKEEIKAAYAATGFKPMHKGWVSQDLTACCPLSAVCAKRIGKEKFLAKVEQFREDESAIDADSAIARVIQQELQLNREEINGFWNGVDGYGWRDFSAWDRHAYDFGQTVLAALQPQFEQETD